MLLIAAYYANHSKHTNTPCGQHVEFLKQLLHLLAVYLRMIFVAQRLRWSKGSWPLVPKFAGSNSAEAVGFLREKKSSARIPSEGK